MFVTISHRSLHSSVFGIQDSVLVWNANLDNWKWWLYGYSQLSSSQELEGTPYWDISRVIKSCAMLYKVIEMCTEMKIGGIRLHLGGISWY